MSLFSDRIREARISLNYKTAKEFWLAADLPITYSYYLNIEEGYRKPNPQLVKILADKLKINKAELFKLYIKEIIPDDVYEMLFPEDKPLKFSPFEKYVFFNKTKHKSLLNERQFKYLTENEEALELLIAIFKAPYPGLKLEYLESIMPGRASLYLANLEELELIIPITLNKEKYYWSNFVASSAPEEIKKANPDNNLKSKKFYLKRIAKNLEYCVKNKKDFLARNLLVISSEYIIQKTIKTAKEFINKISILSDLALRSSLPRKHYLISLYISEDAPLEFMVAGKTTNETDKKAP